MAIECTTWNGGKTSIPSYLFHVNAMKQDSFFAGATWIHTSPGFDLASNYLISSIIEKIPPHHCYFYFYDPCTCMKLTASRCLMISSSISIHKALRINIKSLGE